MGLVSLCLSVSLGASDTGGPLERSLLLESLDSSVQICVNVIVVGGSRGCTFDPWIRLSITASGNCSSGDCIRGGSRGPRVPIRPVTPPKLSERRVRVSIIHAWCRAEAGWWSICRLYVSLFVLVTVNSVYCIVCVCMGLFMCNK